jgi:lipoate-protein ligase A
LTPPWRIETAAGPAAGLLVAPPWDQRRVRVLEPDDRAVVLGSTQPQSHLDAGRVRQAGFSVLRRRGGGGAVLVGPGQVVWTDVVITAGDPLWAADTGRAFWWLGDLWVAALSAAGVAGAEVWKGGLVRSRWSDRVCFAGLGSGEVTVDGAKVVGMSQRRTREGAQFQCAVAIRWDPSELLAVMALDDGARTEAAADLADAATGVGDEAAALLVPAFLDRLP